MGSRKSRSRSPARFAGKNDEGASGARQVETHQAVDNVLRSSEIIRPQISVDGGMPTPSKLMDASSSTNRAI
ncbi:MAG: hypothetical protein ACYC3S_17830 [Chloroflexota bacterium]